MTRANTKMMHNFENRGAVAPTMIPVSTSNPKIGKFSRVLRCARLMRQVSAEPNFSPGLISFSLPERAISTLSRATKETRTKDQATAASKQKIGRTLWIPLPGAI
eukprot:TRINITY_DN2923_c0_g1_i1.p2 TRINITY_DN2923_c0_g1~~TRINITY_DN2923_c0_g1_i1.p2  ORF type:complete len:105 (+),score=6.12 TRINITY_DN2923_c0_g1_i1:338-652(+)